MTKLTVVYDACVLYPAPLRDLLMWLALTDLFQAKWSEKIHQEWIRNVLQNRPDLTLAQLNRTKQLMNQNVEDANITDYEYLIPSLTLPDPDDIHVLATAIHCRADLIITFNLKDFPLSILKNYRLEAISPDDFILELIEMNETQVIDTVTQHRKSLKNPPLTLEKYLQNLTNQRLIQTANSLRDIFSC